MAKNQEQESKKKKGGLLKAVGIGAGIVAAPLAVGSVVGGIKEIKDQKAHEAILKSRANDKWNAQVKAYQQRKNIAKNLENGIVSSRPSKISRAATGNRKTTLKATTGIIKRIGKTGKFSYLGDLSNFRSYN